MHVVHQIPALIQSEDFCVHVVHQILALIKSADFIHGAIGRPQEGCVRVNGRELRQSIERYPYCNTLQHRDERHTIWSPYCNTLQHPVRNLATANRTRRTLQHTATPRRETHNMESTRQHTATHCNTLSMNCDSMRARVATVPRALWVLAITDPTLQHTVNKHDSTRAKVASAA